VQDPPAPPTGSSRLLYLDGLRGWMALVVVLSHLTRTLLLDPPQLSAHGIDRLAFWLKWTPLGVVTDGVQAVYVFFVISGVALSYPVLRASNPDRTLAAMALYRYPRLTVPILASCLAVWLLLALGALPTQAVAAHRADPAWWSELYTFPADFLAMAKFALWRTYELRLPNRESWNVVLWTMPVELLGSFLIFTMLAFIRWRWLRLAVATGLAIHNIGTGFYGYFFGFLAGYLIAELLVAAERRDDLCRELAGATSVGWIYLAAALGSSICLQAASFGHSQADYMLAMNLIALLAVLGVVLAEPARRWLAHPVSQFLGRISFGLYLTHLTVICSFSAALYLATTDTWPYGWMIALVGGLSLPVTLAVGYGFTLVVEEGLLPYVKRPLTRAAHAGYGAIYSFARSSVLRILPELFFGSASMKR
jgi:peptidoglycan/LPS O-acetylase OafA/YrhL